MSILILTYIFGTKVCMLFHSKVDFQNQVSGRGEREKKNCEHKITDNEFTGINEKHNISVKWQ